MAERLLRREHSRSCGRGLQAGTRGPRIEVAPFQPEPIDSAVQLYRARPDKDWSLADCLSFVITERRHLTEALTTDGHFEQAGLKGGMFRSATLSGEARQRLEPRRLPVFCNYGAAPSDGGADHRWPF